jgi:hypothetical protein
VKVIYMQEGQQELTFTYAYSSEHTKLYVGAHRKQLKKRKTLGKFDNT